MANSPSVSLPAPSSAGIKAISITNGNKWLIATVLIVALLYYLIGVDEGAYSIFGSKSMFVHELMHDGRHFLAFPCH